MVAGNQINRIPSFLLTSFPILKRLTYEGNPITWDGAVGQKNVVLQQELIAKFSAIPSSKFLPAAQ